ncbi:hypothetical protein GCM10027085_43360 [Spirosoma aerophilum]
MMGAYLSTSASRRGLSMTHEHLYDRRLIGSLSYPAIIDNLYIITPFGKVTIIETALLIILK